MCEFLRLLKNGFILIIVHIGTKVMILAQTTSPPVPEDTFLAATAQYGKGNIYLRLGDRLEELLDG